MIRPSLPGSLNRYRRGEPLYAEPVVTGHLTRMVGMTMEAVGLNVSLGSRCEVVMPHGHSIEAEVVGFADGVSYLMPTDNATGLQPGALVRPVDSDNAVPVGPGLLGRVLSGSGEPLDARGPVDFERKISFSGALINPLMRKPITETLDVGIRAINALLTVGKGQRMGLFAGSGVGKSVLLGMMTRYTEADIVVVALVGERGREVKEFIDHILGEEGLRRSIVIASPADDVPLMRLRSAMLATRIAEYFRDQGKDVLLLMDSLTRYAQAQREIALAVGEPPASKGYPPSVFARIPQLVERAGNSADGRGSITAFYTVLTEGDDLQDPVADAARAILDGHIVLSRALADEGHYPAISIEASISRAMPNIVNEEQLGNAQRFRQIYARYQQSRDLISVGAYTAGSDAETDLAIERMPHFRQFLQQRLNESIHFAEARSYLDQVVDVKEAPRSQALSKPGRANQAVGRSE